jgi:hypothetical protein
LQATLDHARITLQVDVGYRDAVTPAPPTMDDPSLLPDLPTAPLRVYPKATVVAEKLHAICVLEITNSRMKDYFDLDLPLRDEAVDDGELRRAVTATFERRRSPLPADVPIGLSDAFGADAGKRSQWSAFLRKNRLDAVDLAIVVHRLRKRAARIGIPTP